MKLLLKLKRIKTLILHSIITEFALENKKSPRAASRRSSCPCGCGPDSLRRLGFWFNLDVLDRRPGWQSYLECDGGLGLWFWRSLHYRLARAKNDRWNALCIHRSHPQFGTGGGEPLSAAVKETDVDPVIFHIPSRPEVRGPSRTFPFDRAKVGYLSNDS